MSQKEDLENKLQARLDEYRAEIDRLKALADRAGAEIQLEYYKQIESLRENQEVAKTKLDEFKSAGDGAWEDLKDGVESAWNDLGEALKSAISRFK